MKTMTMGLPFIKFNTSFAVGVDAIFLRTGQVIFNLVQVSVFKNVVEIKQADYGIDSIDEFILKLPNDKPVILTISGIGILYRKRKVSEEHSLIDSFNSLFPHSNFQDFYLQQNVGTENGDSHLSVIRKGQLDSLLEIFQNAKIIKLFIGPFCLNRLIPLLEQNAINDQTLNINRYQLLINNNKIENVHWSEENTCIGKINVGGEPFDTASLVSYASVLDYFMPSATIREIEIESITKKRKDFKYEQKFKMAGIAMAAGFFIILLINFILFNNYFSKNAQLKQKVSLNSGFMNRLDSLNSELESRKKVLNNYNFHGLSKTSFFADQIAGSVPGSITLEELNIFPIRKDNTDEILFDEKKIVVSGYSEKSIDLNEWIKKLQTSQWVSKVSIVSYNQKSERDKGEFSIEIEVNSVKKI